MPKYNNPRRTWKYSNDFKVNAVQLSFVVGVTIKTVSDFNIRHLKDNLRLFFNKYSMKSKPFLESAEC